MIPSFTIETPSLADSSFIFELFQKQFNFHHNLDSFYFIPLSQDLEKKIKINIRNAITQNTPYIKIARSQEKIIGFITYKEDESEYFDSNIQEHGVIIELYVDTSQRQHGIGKALVKSAESFFKSKGHKHILLTASSQNIPAAKFYKKEAFKEHLKTFIKEI